MKFAIYTRVETAELVPLTSVIEACGADYQINPCSCDDFDAAISFGGDGTFLSTARKVVASGTPILGVNGGRLGFLANTSVSDFKAAIAALLSGDYHIEERTMIRVDGINEPHGEALNEFSLQKRTPAMVNIEVTIDGDNVASYWADGAIVSTPTGSTAYAMSVSGAILTPQCRCFAISPIAPHNLNVRPLIVPDTSVITLTINTRYTDNATATIDNRDYIAPNNTTYTLSLSNHTVKIIKPKGNSFYQTLREKLYWAFDPRN